MLKRFIYFVLAVLTLGACVMIPYYTWHSTWFGRPLSDIELTEYLQNQDNPRRIQHALTQVAERMEERGDSSALQWYEEVIRLSQHPVLQVRVTVAWVMGQDSMNKSFHQALLGMLEDDALLVRRNVALSLVAFADTTGLKELRTMLLPHTIVAPVDGGVTYLVSDGDEVHVGHPLVRLSSEDSIHELRSPLSSSIQSLPISHDSAVKAGMALVTLSPDTKHVWESLRAMALIGGTEELKLVSAILENPIFGAEIQSQAILTREAITKRLRKEEKETASPGI